MLNKGFSTPTLYEKEILGSGSVGGIISLSYCFLTLQSNLHRKCRLAVTGNIFRQPLEGGTLGVRGCAETGRTSVLLQGEETVSNHKDS